MKLYTNVTIFFTLWVLLLLLIFYFGYSAFPHSQNSSDIFIINLANWDGEHYLRIAKFGYQQPFQFAFFPLYPLIIRLLSSLTQNYLLSALVISITSTFFALQIIYNLVAYDFGKKIAEGTVRYILFFPTSFFFLTAYSEGLFLLLAVLSFYFFRKNNFLLSAIFAMLVSLTRFVGLAVVIVLIFEVIFKARLNRRNWLILFSPLGFISFSIFLFYTTGDPLYFVSAELHWQRSITFPWVGFWETIQMLSSPGFINTYFSLLWDLIFAVFGLGMILRGKRFLPSLYFIYGLISMVVPLLTTSLMSIPRFLLLIFPNFILITEIKNRYFIFFYQLISVMLLSLFAVLYINGYWVS